MDKLVFSLNVLLISLAAVAYSVHWLAGLAASVVVVIAACDNAPTKGSRHVKHN